MPLEAETRLGVFEIFAPLGRGGIGAVLVPIVANHLGWITALGTGSLLALVGAGLWLLIRAETEVRQGVA